MAKTRKRSISLTRDLDAAIQRRVASGAYASESDVIRAALDALARVEGETERKLAVVDAAIARGIADADAGRVQPGDKVFADLRGRYLERRLMQQGHKT